MELYHKILNSILMTTLIGWSIVLHAETTKDPFQTDRKTFLQAEKFFQQKQRQKFWDLLHKLHEYPLYPYLRYKDIVSRIDSASESEVLTFVKAYIDSPVSGRLQGQWLEALARKKSWKTFIRHYQKTSDTRLLCWYHQALIGENRINESLSQMDAIWLQGSSLPDNCTPVLNRWKEAGAITHEKTMERVILAAQNRNFRLAKYLAKGLGKEEQKWIKTWHKAHIYPASAGDLKWSREHDRIIRIIALHAAKRLLRANPEDGAQLWMKLQKNIPFNQEEIASLNKFQALSFALQHHPDAKVLLNRITGENEDNTIREWRIRTALYNANWDGVLKGYENLTQQEKSDYRWMYWKARALMEKGLNEEAAKILKRLAQTRSYEGFLSADILDRKYHFHHKAIQTSHSDIHRILSMVNIQRARELFILERYADARREWHRAVRKMQKDDLVDAAWLAHTWGWQDQAINTLARAGIWNDLDIRFPLAYYEEIQKHSANYGINPAWALAMIKQESSFMPDARSRSNARGLMQLMPSTARYIAGKINIKIRDTALLYKSKFNIKLGMAYLTYIRDYYNGHTVLATAAYNAGKGRVDKWLPKDRAVAADVWIETIPFRETRNYIRNVLAFMAVYENRMGMKASSLQKYMPDIKPRKEKQVSVDHSLPPKGKS